MPYGAVVEGRSLLRWEAAVLLSRNLGQWRVDARKALLGEAARVGQLVRGGGWAWARCREMISVVSTRARRFDAQRATRVVLALFSLLLLSLQ